MVPIRNVVAALMWRGDEILLVQEQGADDPEPIWMLPGGVVESGELLAQALTREVAEETGLTARPERLLYVVQLDNQHPRTPGRAPYLATTFVFEVTDWGGEIHVADPDCLVLHAEWVALGQALQRIERVPFRIMCEPLLAYLRHEVTPGTMWFYQRSGEEKDQLVGTIGGSTE